MSRREGERIFVGDGVIITILEVKGKNVVRVGVEAPRDTPIYREEVYRSMVANGQIEPIEGR